jgi:hypothetical protein
MCQALGTEKCIVFWLVNLNEGKHLGDLVVDGRMILKWVLKTGCEGGDSIDLAQKREGWRDPVTREWPSGSIKCGEYFNCLRTC